MIIPRVSKDELWKGIIESMFEDFLHFFFPEFVESVDFSKPYEFLNKELQELIPASESQNRKADVLVKVFLKNGREKWILIHIEVQGYEDSDFPLRMYVYNYRIFDRFDAEIVALAILTDENVNYRPNYYERKTWNTTIRYDFGMYKLLDHEEMEFEQSSNPFASVMQIARSFIRNKSLKTDDDLLSLKLQLFKTMCAKGYRKEVIRKIANFIKLYVFFKNHEYFIKFEKEFDNITNNQPTMGILELIKQKTLEEAERIGKEKGKEEGISEGITNGISKERRKSISKMLAKKFDFEMIADILEISISEVEFVEEELRIKSYFQQGLTIKEVNEIFEKLEQKMLHSEAQLTIFYQTVQVEQLLSEGLSVEAIAEKLDLSDVFVFVIQEMMK